MKFFYSFISLDYSSIFWKVSNILALFTTWVLSESITF